MARLSHIGRFVAALRELDLAHIGEADVACSRATIDDFVDSWGIPDDAQSDGRGVLIFIWRDVAANALGRSERNTRFVYPTDHGCYVFSTGRDATLVMQFAH